jgi:hypothetical protein
LEFIFCLERVLTPFVSFLILQAMCRGMYPLMAFLALQAIKGQTAAAILS